MVSKTNEISTQNGSTTGALSLLASWADTLSASLADEELTSDEYQPPQEITYEARISDVELTRECLRAAAHFGIGPATPQEGPQAAVSRYSIKSGFAKRCTGKAAVHPRAKNRAISAIVRGNVAPKEIVKQRSSK